MSQKDSNTYNVCAAIQAGLKAAWFGRTNPYVVGGELWKAFNRGRRMAAECAPGLSAEFVWYNSYTFEGLLWSEVSSITDGLIG
jgi:hypothetical protein